MSAMQSAMVADYDDIGDLSEKLGANLQTSHHGRSLANLRHTEVQKGVLEFVDAFVGDSATGPT